LLSPPYDEAMSDPASAIRQPRQKRSQEAYARVLHAGREILEQDGVEGFTVQAVSKRAGVSVGSIYLRAPSREALLLAIQADELERMEREEIWLDPAAPLPDSVREYVEGVVTKTAQQMLGNARILRAFMRRGPEDPEVWERGRAGSQRVASLFEAALLVCRDSIRHPDPDTAVDFAFRMVYSMTARRITHGSEFESTRPLSDDRYLRELARAVADYLLGTD
jgi:AcrR family transcriptional regulator